MSFLVHVLMMIVLSQDCMSALCRYIAVNGWSSGLKHITSPTDLVDRVGQGQH